MAKNKPNPRPTSYAIRMGLPEMDALWNHYTDKNAKLSKDEVALFKKLGKALAFLSQNPAYPSLQTHEISTLTKRYGQKVYQSYLENHTPSAARMFWVYGSKNGEIIILGLEPHPEPNSYGRIKLDQEPQ